MIAKGLREKPIMSRKQALAIYDFISKEFKVEFPDFETLSLLESFANRVKFGKQYGSSTVNSSKENCL